MFKKNIKIENHEFKIRKGKKLLEIKKIINLELFFKKLINKIQDGKIKSKLFSKNIQIDILQFKNGKEKNY